MGPPPRRPVPPPPAGAVDPAAFAHRPDTQYMAVVSPPGVRPAFPTPGMANRITEPLGRPLLHRDPDLDGEVDPPSEPPSVAKRHWPALDGVRAFAVVAVLLYHAGVTWLPGGLLGVDLFFVLSGFLITGLLLEEWNVTGRIDLARFWARRARRLLPALLMVLLAVAAYARFVAEPAQAGSLRVDALSTLFYVANWRFALSHQSYFNQLNPPSPLLHTWSLAVEEQFYVIWPLIVLLLLLRASTKTMKKRRARRPAAIVLRGVALFGAVASAVCAFALAVAGTDHSRIYYGTDTRAQALFVGAGLAAAMAAANPRPTVWVRVMLHAAGLLGAVVIGAVWLTVDGLGETLYRGVFLLFALAGAGLLACVVALPRSPLARLLSLAPLRYLGRISYGVYLWHWPIFLTLTAGRTHLSGPGLLAVRFGATFVVSALSFRYVEQPIRQRTFRLPAPKLATPAVVGAVAVAVVLITSSVKGDTGSNVDEVEKLAASAASTKVAPKSTAANRPVRVLLAGDSVALTFGVGLPPAKTKPYGVELIDRGVEGCGIVGNLDGRYQGTEGMPRPECIPWVANYRSDVASTDPDVAALLVGRWEVTDRKLNGVWTSVGHADMDRYLSGQLDQAIEALSSKGAKVALLTAPAFNPQEAPNGDYYPESDPNRVVAFNRLLRAAAARHPGVATVVDFGHVLTPDDQYVSKIDGKVVRWTDGVHVSPDGAELEAKAIFPELVRLGRSSPNRNGRSGPPTAARG